MDRFDAIRNGGYVSRYHTLRTIKQQTVAEHSWGVAQIILDLWPQSSITLVQAALDHDVLEFLTGDIPAPVKRQYPDFYSALKKVEEELDFRFDLRQPLTPEEHQRLRIADWLELCLFAFEEVRLGNVTFKEVLGRGVEYIRSGYGHLPDGVMALEWLEVRLSKNEVPMPTLAV